MPPQETFENLQLMLRIALLNAVLSVKLMIVFKMDLGQAFLA